MQPSEFSRFRSILAGMAEMFGKELSSPLLDAYWLSLKAWPLAEFEQAAAHLLSESEFMPRPAAFAALRRAASQDTAAEAWLAARQCLQWGLHGYTVKAGTDPLVAKALGVIGGANVLAMCDEQKLHFLERRFAEAYESLAEKETARQAVPLLAVVPKAIGNG